MKVLIVKPHLPLPAHQGTRRVTMGLIRDLSSVHDVSYLCMLEDVDEVARVADLQAMGVTVRAPLMPNRHSPFHRLAYRCVNDCAAWMTGYPRDYFYSTPPVLANALQEWTTDTSFDLVILEYWKLARLVPHVRSGHVFILAHDAEFVKRARQTAALGTGTRDRVAGWRLAREARREIETLKRCPSILALTERDRDDIAAALGAGYDGDIRVLPVAASTAPGDPARHAPIADVGFLGSFKGDFNVDAVRFLLDDVWPRVRRQQPHATLAIAGGDAPTEWRRYDGQDGVTFLGFVQDLNRFFDSIKTLVVPLRFGGGLRIRILDALMARAAVVSTSVGVAGLDVASGEHVLVADGPDAIARDVCRVLSDDSLRARLMNAGHTFVAERYSPDVVGKETRALFTELMRTRTAA